METTQLIAADEFCSHHNIEVSFITSLSDLGLIHITRMEEKTFVDTNELEPLEKMVRLHYDLHINLEGIEAITHLLNRFQQLQHEASVLQNKLRFYEQINGTIEV
ncbi:MAG: hypothetical protein JWQ96_402 [Segetibacter sp.]|nr:hypothetical protein [Segetibacter sp.]